MAAAIARDMTVPYALRTALANVDATTRAAARTHRATLVAALERLHGCAEAFCEEDPGHIRPRADVARKIVLVTKAIEALADPVIEDKCAQMVRAYTARFRELDHLEADRARREAAASRQAETRFLPTVAQQEAAASAGAGDRVKTCAAGNVTLLSSMTLSMEPVNHAKTLAKEVQYAAGMETRPVELTSFDMCPRCHVAMQHNPGQQQLVCPVPTCGHWKRFADMTSTALAFGEEVEYTRYMYKPVSHLDDIMRNMEGSEPSVVPASVLETIIRYLKSKRVPPEEVTIPVVRQAISALQLKYTEHTVQVYSRLTGRAPRRMTTYMKDQIRIMFHMQEEPYRRYCKDRSNSLSFTYTLYKFCELLGYWEMLEPLPLLRGTNNLADHDSIFSKVCNELQWDFVPTVGTDALALR